MSDFTSADLRACVRACVRYGKSQVYTRVFMEIERKIQLNCLQTAAECTVHTCSKVYKPTVQLLSFPFKPTDSERCVCSAQKPHNTLSGKLEHGTQKPTGVATRIGDTQTACILSMLLTQKHFVCNGSKSVLKLKTTFSRWPTAEQEGSQAHTFISFEIVISL